MRQHTVLVVGGASGIGFASARALSLADYRVIVADRDATRLNDAVDLLRTSDPSVEGRELDVTDPDAVSSTIEGLARDFGLDGLVNAAGVLQLGSILDVEEADWMRVVDINLGGVYRCARAAIAAMLSTGNGGSIVNLTSQSGRTKSFYSAPNYVASKAGVIGLTMVLAAQHAAQGIRVNAIAPGLVETEMIANIYSPEQRASMIAGTPIGRFASAEEIADVVVFLISNHSSYITGQTINVNGGSFMQ